MNLTNEEYIDLFLNTAEAIKTLKEDINTWKDIAKKRLEYIDKLQRKVKKLQDESN